MKATILVLHAFRDLIIANLPRMRKRGGFAFIVHPRNIPDVYRKYSFLKILPEKYLKLFLKYYWPVVLSEVEGLKDEHRKNIKGWIITIPLTPEQMLKDRSFAQKKIIRSIKLAEKMGAQIVGLGALTASLTRGGLDLKNKVKIGVTTGRAYTTQNVISTTLAIMKRLETEIEKTTFAIVGAAGGIGSACIKVLATQGAKNFILIETDRKKDSVYELIREIKKNTNTNFSFKISSKINHIYPADIIIAATNAPEVIIHPFDLKPGAVIVNDAQPSDISPHIYEEREDVLVIEGGIINTPGIKYHFNFGLYDKEDTFCCLGEVMALAHINQKEDYAIGYLDINLIDDISKVTQKLNFHLAEFQNPVEGKISPEKITRVKNIIKGSL